MTLVHAPLIVAVLALVACAGPTAEKSNPQTDPANPQAAEAPRPPPPLLNEPDPLLTPPPAEVDGMEGMHHMHHGNSAAPVDETAPADAANAEGDSMPGMHHGDSMPGMHHGAGGAGHGVSPSKSRDRAATKYVCPMHPEVRKDAPGRCPKCGMTLVPAITPSDGGTR